MALSRWYRALAAAAALAALAALAAVAPAASAAGSPWRLVWSTHFTQAAPRGSFSRCTGMARAVCYGLPAPLRSQWWAYPDGWPDTSTLRHLRVHGYYSPSTTVWISHGVMNLRLWRGATGSVHSAAVLPKAVLRRRYGRYVETFRVLTPNPGYLSAHMLRASTRPTDGSAVEVDYPNGLWGRPIYAFYTHRRYFRSAATFGAAWHTSVIKWTPAGMSFYLDGRLLGQVPHLSDVPMNWILQNETQVNPAHPEPPPGSSSTLQIRHVAYYAWAG